MKQIVIFLLVAFFIGGCGDNNSDTISNSDSSIISDSNATVILTTDERTITLNKDRIEIDVTVIDNQNNPYNGGDVKIIYPDDVREGRDIGYFASSDVLVVNGHAKFTYTAPNDISENTNDIIFYFYHENNINDLKKYTIKLVPEQNQIILTNYQIYIDDDEEPSMGLDSSKLISFMVKNEKNENIDDSQIKSITVTSLNPSLATLENTQDDNGSNLITLGKNSVPISVKSNTLSGIIPLQVSAVFIDANGKEQSLLKIFNLLVLSGPPTAMSLAYSETTQDKANAKFIEKWVLTVTDKYNNLVNTNPSVSMGMIAGYTQSADVKSSNLGNYLYFDNNGTINKTTNTFSTNQNVFAKVDKVNDVLVTFGNGYTYEASGKWDINTNDTNNTLDLVDAYNGKTTPSLGFAVGHNYRQDPDMRGVEWVGNVYPENNNYIIDDSGHLILNVEYDYYLTGKDVMLWVNLIGMQNDNMVRIGEARKITLRANGIEVIDPIVNNWWGYKDTNETEQKYTFKIKISGTEEYYRHANFEIEEQYIGSYVNINNDNINYSTINDNEANVTFNVTLLKNDDNLTYDNTYIHIYSVRIKSEFK